MPPPFCRQPVIPTLMDQFRVAQVEEDLLQLKLKVETPTIRRIAR